MSRASLLFAPILLLLAPACARCDSPSTGSATSAPEVQPTPPSTAPRSTLVSAHLDASAKTTPTLVERPSLGTPAASVAH